jgi:hypothetical protein
MVPSSELTPDDFATRLKARSAARRARSAPLTPERLSYRKAAALLSTFDPRRLRTPSGDGGGAAVHLVDDVTSISARSDPVWTLRPAVREEALRSFDGPEDALAHLEANLADVPDPGTPWVVRALLRGEQLDLGSMDARQLTRVRKAMSWLQHVSGVTGLPDGDVERQLEVTRLVEPLRALLQQPFAGRESEREVLREHVGLLPAISRVLPRSGRTWTSRRRRTKAEYPLVIHGPGGIGKSTLLARFMIDHIDDPDIATFPFVYVDSERATVWLHEPMSLVAEMARQLSVQYPDFASDFASVGAAARDRGREQRSRLEDLGEMLTQSSTRVRSRSALQQAYATSKDEGARVIEQLGLTLARAVGPGKNPPPFVVALDSFEEAQYRASPVLDQMWTMLASLRAAYPRTRVIVAGRAPVGHPTIDIDDVPTLELGELDRGAAVAFLRDRGVGPALARAVIDRVGGNPLSLQLAAKVARATQEAEQDDTWLEEIPAKRRRFFGAVDDMLIQGMLYDRVLQHVTDPEVRALAHLGLVLRRITPELIRDVLAPHAQVPLTHPERHHELFEELARELDLVDRVAPDVLRHRSDVRRVMLRLLATDKNLELRTLERAVIDFYTPSERPVERAEELYHRLRLGESLTEVETRWMPEVAPRLESIQPELPTRSARMLTRLLRSSPEGGQGEDQYEWEHRTADEVEHLLTQDFAGQALAVLSQRQPWTVGSPLHALLAETQMRLGRYAEARATLTMALEAPGIEEHADSHLELLLLSARLMAGTGDLSSADADLEVAERAAMRQGNELDALAVLLERARLHEAAGSPHEAAAERALVHRVDSIPDELLTRRPALFRAVAAEVAESEPAVMTSALRLVGLPVVSEQAIHTLASAIVEAIGQPAVPRVLAELADEDLGRWSAPRLDEVERLLSNAGRSGRLDEVASHLLAVDAESSALRHGIAEAMVELVDPLAPAKPRPHDE